jgi:serine/threonine protein kinase
MFSSITHRNLLKVKEQVDDVLVLDEPRGDNLTSFIGRKPLSREHVSIIFSQLCDLLAALHAQGVVHHDFRADVFFINPDKQLFLTDMGLAASDLLPDPVIEAGLGPQGEFMYMSPEQITGKRGDPRSDIYSLGVLLFLATTGSFPFAKGTDSLKKWLLAKEQFILTENYPKNLSVEMVKIITKAMAYDVDKRYQWVEDFWEDLEQQVRGLDNEVKRTIPLLSKDNRGIVNIK